MLTLAQRQRNYEAHLKSIPPEVLRQRLAYVFAESATAYDRIKDLPEHQEAGQYMAAFVRFLLYGT